MLQHLLRCHVFLRLRRCSSTHAPGVQCIHRFANLRLKHARILLLTLQQGSSTPACK